MWRVRSPADGAVSAGTETHLDPTVTRAPLDAEDTTSRDSVLVSGGTAIARLTGVARVVIIGAVLGPTTFGNAFQITNSLPNLIYYGFLAGSLVSTLLVPVLVRHLVAGDAATVPTVARGFLGLALAGTAATLPVMVLGLPWLLHLASSGTPVPTADEQVRLVTVLAMLTAPQVILYAVAGTGAAVMYAHRRFALPACAPALENIGLIIVLGVCAATYGVRSEGETVPLGELLLLGLGATAAVGLHAGVQWWGAYRCGVTLKPALGWAVPEVRAIVARAVRSMTQAGLLAAQTVAMLVVMARVPGGVVALQIALNFYFLPLALVATPVGLAVLPRLARLYHRGELATFWDAYARGVMLALFLVVPASAGYVAVAQPIARVVGVGQMATPHGYDLIAQALAMLSLGLAGAAVFFISTQASYARDDARRPLRSMAVQTVVCLLLIGLAVAFTSDATLVRAVAAAYAVGCLVGAMHLFATVTAGARTAARSCLRAAGRVLIGTVAMLPALIAVVLTVPHLVPGRPGSLLAVVGGTLSGALVFGGVQALFRAPELSWLRSAFRSRDAAMGVGAS
ncbi:MAG TPA: lipid II flippase MurJ [Nocardioides sp.]|jgi:putative peptidoglycan lipid II flippase